MKPQEAKFVWHDSLGQGRNLFSLFRKTVTLQEDVSAAELHLFADTSYQLFVNGEFIDFGPVRFDPLHPQYDTHNIAPYLHVGDNVIAVQVNYYGHKTFMSIPAQAGFIAWGSIETASGEIVSLSTQSASWKAKPAHAYSRYTPKASFALKAFDLFDQAHEEVGWKQQSFNDSDWQPAVELANQDIWGPLSPRSIPFMTKKSIGIERVTILPLQQHEDWYSFDVPAPFKNEEGPTDFSPFVAYSTWIYSPIDQVVTVGVFYGENWINGEKVHGGVESINKSMRINQRWPLFTGWNYYFGCVNVYQDILDHYFALPRGKGLSVSATKSMDEPYTFRHSRILSAANYDEFLKTKALPYKSNETLDAVGGWVLVTAKDKAQSPCRETSWDDYGDPIETITPDTLTTHVFRHEDYPEGFAILLDLGHTHLLMPRLKLKGVADATVDLTYSEHLLPDNQHLRHQSWVSIGDRMLCHDDAVDWLLSQPRGTRYLKITVRNTKADVHLGAISLRSTNYPTEEIGQFECSDPAFNAIWEMGRRTQATNMEDVYVDCPERERVLYGRDSIIQYHINLVTFGDHALMRRCLELFGQSPDTTGKFRACYPNTGDYTIADFALNMAEGYLAYYEQTGDKSLIESCWNAMEGNLAWFHALADEREDLLLDAEWHVKRGIDAHYGGFHGDNDIAPGLMDNTGIHCAFSCTYLLALQSALVLARAIGKETAESDLERRIAILSHSISSAFWDDDLGCYADNVKKTTHSVQANLLAVRAGVVTEWQFPRLCDYVRRILRTPFVNGYDPTNGTLVSPHYSFYILDGLYKAGLIETAETLIRQGWGWMLSQGLKTCPEFFNLNFSLCHAWSGSPTYYLSKHILGVHFPEKPNLDIVEIRVQTHSVMQAKGAYPHPKGAIEVAWHMEDGRRVFDTVKGPEGVEVRIVG